MVANILRANVCLLSANMLGVNIEKNRGRTNGFKSATVRAVGSKLPLLDGLEFSGPVGRQSITTRLRSIKRPLPRSAAAAATSQRPMEKNALATALYVGAIHLTSSVHTKQSPATQSFRGRRQHQTILQPQQQRHRTRALRCCIIDRIGFIQSARFCRKGQRGEEVNIVHTVV